MCDVYHLTQEDLELALESFWVFFFVCTLCIWVAWSFVERFLWWLIEFMQAKREMRKTLRLHGNEQGEKS